MHNLMLGTTKKMLQIWKELNLPDEQDFKVLQKRINKLKVPSSIGRIPSKIASGFKGFTADQFKNWAVVFSSFALKGILPDRHLQCWKLFVKACCILQYTACFHIPEMSHLAQLVQITQQSHLIQPAQITQLSHLDKPD